METPDFEIKASQKQRHFFYYIFTKRLMKSPEFENALPEIHAQFWGVHGAGRYNMSSTFFCLRNCLSHKSVAETNFRWRPRKKVAFRSHIFVESRLKNNERLMTDEYRDAMFAA